MELRSLADGSLELEERWTLLRLGCASGAVAIPLAVAWSRWGEDPLPLGSLALAALGGLILFSIASAVTDHRTLFDVRSRTVRWQQRSWLRARGGELPFDEVEGVIVTAERASDGEPGSSRLRVDYGLALRSRSGAIRLTATHGPSRAEYAAVAEAIRAALARPS
ncbi:MAG TPA: hypothetical protein VKH41_16180 [Myxococcota bacterium]|nr:hypothetical protein [Myxococcota bacterium]